MARKRWGYEKDITHDSRRKAKSRQTEALWYPQNTQTRGPFVISSQVVAAKVAAEMSVRRRTGDQALKSLPQHNVFCGQQQNSTNRHTEPPVSPIVCNLYMENFEKIELSSAPSPTSMWLRYVDDTFVKIHEYDVDGFTAHINSIDRNMQFTTEPELNNKLPFLDLCIHVKEDTNITIYRKPTHTDQYLNFSSNHSLEHKCSVVRTLTHRVKEFITTSEDQEWELKHVHSALCTNGYTEWVLVIPKQKAKPKPTVSVSGLAKKGGGHQGLQIQKVVGPDEKL